MLNTGTLPKALKELVIVRTSQLNRTPYCLASHSAICRKLGWTDEQLAAMGSNLGAGGFTEREQVAIHMAEVMTLDAHGYTTEDFSRLRSFFSEGEVVELMAAVGLFNYFNRFNDLLEMEPTKPATAGRACLGKNLISGSGRANPKAGGYGYNRIAMLYELKALGSAGEQAPTTA